MVVVPWPSSVFCAHGKDHLRSCQSILMDLFWWPSLPFSELPCSRKCLELLLIYRFVIQVTAASLGMSPLVSPSSQPLAADETMTSSESSTESPGSRATTVPILPTSPTSAANLNSPVVILSVSPVASTGVTSPSTGAGALTRQLGALNVTGKGHNCLIGLCCLVIVEFCGLVVLLKIRFRKYICKSEICS